MNSSPLLPLLVNYLPLSPKRNVFHEFPGCFNIKWFYHFRFHEKNPDELRHWLPVPGRPIQGTWEQTYEKPVQ